MEGGLIGMRNGEHRRGLHLAAQKYYVVGRARLKGFDVDEDTDMKHTLPLSAQKVFRAMRAARPETVADYNPGGALREKKSFDNFVETVWKPTVLSSIDASSDLEQGPGRYCYDIKVSKLQDRKKRDDDDINGAITRTRAIEILRILRTKLSELPRRLINLLFRGPKVNGRYTGLVVGEYPDNEHDEPFSQNEDKDFLYSRDYDKDEGPTYETFSKPWGLVVVVLKPGQALTNAAKNSLENL
jgi:hypothetical protein